MCELLGFLAILTLCFGITEWLYRREAWKRRREGILWIEGMGVLCLFRPSLFTDEGNVWRIRALKMLGATHLCLVAGVLLLMVARSMPHPGCIIH